VYFDKDGTREYPLIFNLIRLENLGYPLIQEIDSMLWRFSAYCTLSAGISSNMPSDKVLKATDPMVVWRVSA